MTKPGRLFLLDGMALAYRAHFAFIQRPIMTSSGVNTSALFGFTSTLLDLFHRHQPTHMAVAFDTDAPTERHLAFPAYKGTRQEMPDDLSQALPTLHRLVEAFRIPALLLDGYEADDIIGTLAVQGASAGMEVAMVTPDKDFGQLVTPHIRILKPGYKGGEEEWIGPDEVVARWDIAQASQVTDMLGLCGDSSDNIPGVPGIGPKTAAKLLREFGSLEGVLENCDRQKGKLRENLEQYADQARLSKKLAMINTAVPIAFNEEQLRVTEPDTAAVEQLFDELEFRTLKKRFLSRRSTEPAGFAIETSEPVPHAAAEELFEQPRSFNRLSDVPHAYRVIDAATQPDELAGLIEALAAEKEFSFDFETTALDPLTARPLGLALCWKPHEAVYVAFPEDITECQKILRRFQPVFSDPGKLKIGQNLKYDLSILMRNGIEPCGPFADTMLAHALLDPEGRHGMDAMARNLLNYEPIPFESVATLENGIVQTKGLDHAALAEYAAEDADVTLQLHRLL
ncbi:MAG: 5'-3' exonuclease H3TH domain-containing protein, partial [Verrucomicrobiia bacterium]